MYFEKTINGIEFTEEIISINGAYFTLFITKAHTPEMIKQAKAEIRDQRDVVAMHIAGEQEWNERYRDEIFRHPLTRPLHWYEINADTPHVLKYHRLKGTPVEEYISRFVLPCKAETKARNMKKIGDWIINY